MRLWSCVLSSLFCLAPASALATLLGTSALGELTGTRTVASGGGLQGFNDYDNGIFQVD